MSASTIRLGIDFHEWDGIFQGSRNHVLGIYKEAIRIAPDVNFIFFLNDIESLRREHEEFRAPNVKLVRMSAGGLARLGFHLPYLCWRHRIDVLHTQYRVPFLRLAKSVCTIHDILFESHPKYFSWGFRVQSSLTFRLAARVSKHVFTVSNYSKSELVRRYGISPDKVSVTYNGVNPKSFYPGKDGEDVVRALGLVPGQYVLTLGRLEPRKNQVALIKAWQNIYKDIHCPLVIVGQADKNFPDIKDQIDACAKRLPVMQFSNMGDDVLPAVLRHARVFAYPAFAEGFGMPVAEAMASGVPVVTSDTTSLPEVAGDGAILCDPHDPTSIEAALRRALLMSADERGELVRAALQQAQTFNWRAPAMVLVDRVRMAAQS